MTDEERKARNAYIARRRRKGLPLPRLPVSSYRAWWTVALLREAGFTYQRIAEVSGVSKRSIHDVMRTGPTTPITFTMHERLTALDLDAIIGVQTPSRRVPAAPYREKLRQYGAAGWPRSVLENAAGLTPGEENIWRSRSRWITPETAAKLDALFAKIGERAGPSIPTARRYREAGYGPPAAYDDNGRLLTSAVPQLPPPVRLRKAR